MNNIIYKSNIMKKAKERNKCDKVNKIFKSDNKHFKNKIQLINRKYIFEWLIFINLFIVILSIQKFLFLESKISNITLKMRGIGYKKIFRNTTNFKEIDYPNEVYINGEKQNTLNYTYYFNQTDNIVELFWNKLIDIFSSFRVIICICFGNALIL